MSFTEEEDMAIIERQMASINARIDALAIHDVMDPRLIEEHKSLKSEIEVVTRTLNRQAAASSSQIDAWRALSH
ncbi:MAG: hypothetical protein ACRYG4_12125 [Janthinobacterium lividum]